MPGFSNSKGNAMKGGTRLDDSELRQYAENHLAREVEMLRWTGSFLSAFTTATLSSERIAGDIAQAFRESSVESFAMHARNLIDFLYLRNHYGRDRSNDIVIEDYVGNDAVANRLVPITQLLIDARTKADKLIAHLATERETFGYYQKSWMFSQIAVDLLAALRSVVHDVPARLESGRLLRSVSSSLPLFIDIRLRQYSVDDERGPGLALEYGMWHRPQEYGHA